MAGSGHTAGDGRSGTAGTGRDAAAAVAGAVPPPPWAREQSPRRARADRPALSREAIVEAALRIIDEEGYDAVSMRRVAQEFGTGAASLYAYVANKDELLDLVVDQVMSENEVPDAQPDPDVDRWIEQLKDAVRASYRVLVSHRDVAKAFQGRIPFGPKGLRNIEDLLNLLRAHGLPDHISAYLGDLIGQYVVGQAIEDQMWRERFPDASPEQLQAAVAELGDYLRALPVDRFPNLTSIAHLLVGGSHDPDSPMGDRFELGLDIIMRGVAAFLPVRGGD
jgi:TetR/AcrR family transcriptional regulator, tetracycline repressor protein